MALYLEVLAGDAKGARFPIKVGFRLGRNTGEIIIKDKKISSLHAQIETQDDRLVLVDRGSSNGLLINNQKVKSIIMAPGVNFIVGRTQLQVIELSEDFELTNFQSPQAESKIQPPGWKDVLHRQIPLLLLQNNESKVNLQPFLPALQLDFIQGPETDRTIVLGYGPRKFGSRVLDIELHDRHAPELAFEIIPEGERARIVTKDSLNVQLNGRKFFEEYLSPGDVIQFGKSIIKISHHKAE